MRSAPRLLMTAAALALLTACASAGSGPYGRQAADPNAPEVNEPGDIPDTQAFVPFSPPSGGYTITVPEGWARTDEGGAVTFTDKFNAVRLESVPAATAPTTDRARTTDVPALRAASHNFALGDVRPLQRNAGPAVLITYTADGPVEPVTGKVTTAAVERYEFWRDGTELIVTLSGAEGADNVDPWRTITDSLRWQ